MNTIEELITFMDEEAAKWGREDSTNTITNSQGIKKQWEEQCKKDVFPTAVFYMEGIEVNTGIKMEIKSLWVDKDGNKTKRPKDF